MFSVRLLHRRLQLAPRLVPVGLFRTSVALSSPVADEALLDGFAMAQVESSDAKVTLAGWVLQPEFGHESDCPSVALSAA